jgi:hypothetical protein
MKHASNLILLSLIRTFFEITQGSESTTPVTLYTYISNLLILCESILFLLLGKLVDIIL